MVRVSAEPAAEGWVCQVLVDDRGVQTRHVVTVRAEDLARWGRGDDAEALVRRSFEFLLRREPPTSILRRFDLSLIPSYFPEYDGEISRG